MQSIAMIHQILHGQEPESIVCCGGQACHIADQWAQEHPRVRVTKLNAQAPNDDLPLTEIHDLAVISDTLEDLSQAQARLLLGQLRNAGARRMVVLVNAPKTWRFADFIGLGFKRTFWAEGDSPQSLYTYDIANYNHKRKWNNADNWANPEMWDKGRY